MTATNEVRRCAFCAKRLPPHNPKRPGDPWKHCKPLHTAYMNQLRYLTNLRSRLQSENSGV